MAGVDASFAARNRVVGNEDRVDGGRFGTGLTAEADHSGNRPESGTYGITDAWAEERRQGRTASGDVLGRFDAYVRRPGEYWFKGALPLLIVLFLAIIAAIRFNEAETIYLERLSLTETAVSHGVYGALGRIDTGMAVIEALETARTEAAHVCPQAHLAAIREGTIIEQTPAGAPNQV